MCCDVNFLRVLKYSHMARHVQSVHGFVSVALFAILGDSKYGYSCGDEKCKTRGLDEKDLIKEPVFRESRNVFAPNSRSKIPLTTELLYPLIRNFKRACLHTRNFRLMHPSIDTHQSYKNGFPGQTCFRSFREKQVPGRFRSFLYNEMQS